MNNWETDLRILCEKIPLEVNITTIHRLVTSFRKENPNRTKYICKQCHGKFSSLRKAVRICDQCRSNNKAKRQQEDQERRRAYNEREYEEAHRRVSEESGNPYQQFKALYLIMNHTSEVTLSKMPYDDFLRTKYWSILKRFKLLKAKYSCELCGMKNTELHVHHKTYDNRGSEYRNLNDIIVVCSMCHRRIHNIKETAVNE